MIHGASKVWYRDFVVWTRYWWTSLIGATAEPVLYFLAMGYGLGSFVRDIDGIPYIQFLAPALICSAVMHSASFETTYSSFTRMEIQKTYHSIATTPVNLNEVILGEILWGATKSLLSGGIMFLAVTAFGYVASWQAVWLVPVLVIEALLFASLGMLVTSYAKDYDYFTYYITLFLEPMFLFSGTFFPLSSLPESVQKIAWLLPLAHPVAIARSVCTGHPLTTASFVSIGWMLLLAAGFGAWSVRKMVKRLLV